MAVDLQADRFKLVGGRLCLDFVNTVGGRVAERVGKTSRYTIRSERLGLYSDLLAWGVQAGALSGEEARSLLRKAERDGRGAGAVLERARGLREAIYRVFKAVAAGEKPERPDLDVVNAELQIARDHEWVASDSGSFHWAWDSAARLDRPIWPVARSAAELLTSDDLSRTRQCTGEACGWLFLDTSRNRSRQWCDMKDCGNLAKVRRFRQKQLESQ
jgi:predicted RNA-binding Zn ribbon-like protein